MKGQTKLGSKLNIFRIWVYLTDSLHGLYGSRKKKSQDFMISGLIKRQVIMLCYNWLFVWFCFWWLCEPLCQAWFDLATKQNQTIFYFLCWIQKWYHQIIQICMPFPCFSHFTSSSYSHIYCPPSPQWIDLKIFVWRVSETLFFLLWGLWK